MFKKHKVDYHLAKLLINFHFASIFHEITYRCNTFNRFS
jgi:hypothetical protein